MNQINRIQKYMESVNEERGHSINIDFESLKKEAEQEHEKAGIIVKILMYLGGLLSSLFFCLFIFLAGGIDNFYVLLVFGIILISLGILVNNNAKKLFEDSFGSFSFMLGQVLIAVAFFNSDFMSKDLAIFGMILLNIISLPFLKRYLLHFFCYTALAFSLALWIGISKIDDLFYVYQAIVIFSVLVLTLYEDKCIDFYRKNIDKFAPLRDVMIITYLFCLLNFMDFDFHFSLSYNWVITCIVLGCFIFSIYKVAQENNMTSKLMLFLIPVLLIAILTIHTPYIIGSFYLLFLSIYINHKTIKGISMISVIYSLFYFYYDLELTLLEKSLILMISGVFILLIYWIVFHKKLIK